MADDVELENPTKRARLERKCDDFIRSDRAAGESNQYSTFALNDADLTNQRNVGEGGQTDDEHPETSKSSLEPVPDSDNDSSVSGLSNMSGLSAEESWKPVTGPMSWVYRQMSSGMDPRAILRQIIPHETNIPDLDDFTLWKLVINIMCEPPPRTKLDTVNTLVDVVQLMKTCKNIMVLTGAGVSVSCGIPDFRSRNGVYARLAVDYPDLPDPQAMFDIHYFRNDQRPFFKFAKEIYPGQFEPSKCHRFIQLIEEHGKLLRNYTQNIDTLEQVAGISRIIQCHGSFATATCMVCGHKCTAEDIKADIMEQKIPFCPHCPAGTSLAVMKPDIVFFGESLPEEFHNQMAADKETCDLLIVIGSSLKVRPVALIPNSLPPHVPQILINKEPLKSLNFDVELLGDCDTIVSELCRQLGEGWDILARDTEPLTEVLQDQLLTPPLTPTVDVSSSITHTDNGNAVDKEITQSTENKVIGNPVHVTDSCTDSAENERTSSGTQDHTSKFVKGKVVELPDSSCKCSDSKDVDTQVNSVHKIIDDDSDRSVECNRKEICDKSYKKDSTSGGENGTADKKAVDKESVVCDAKETSSKDLEEKQQENVLDVQSSEQKNEQESNIKPMEMGTQEVCQTRRTHTCSESSVCYGDKDTCGCSADINELRKMWKPAILRCSVSKRLGSHQYCFMPPSRYVFPEAEVYTVLEDSDSESDSDKEELDDLSEIDGSSEHLNTSEEQMDQNNSCSDQDRNMSASEKDAKDISQDESVGRTGTDNQEPTKTESGSYTRHKKQDSSVYNSDSKSSKESEGENSNSVMHYPLVTTSNELSDSLMGNFDQFAKLVKDETGVDKTETANQSFHFDFEGT